MLVRKELVATPKTLLGIHTVFGEKQVSVVYYMVWENLGPRFFDDVMSGGYPYPLSDVIGRHVTCLGSYCIKVSLALR